MKKLLLTVLIAMACVAQVNAQQFVTTEVTQRNVVIEEFTGRNCGYCPDGHRIANGLMAANPGRLWAVNIHAGGYAPTSYPNFNTPDGTTIHNYFNISGYPCGAVNRSSATPLDRGQWTGAANNILNQDSYVNLGGQVILNPVTRTALITVEAYYTGDSPAETNQLTVMMLQDSIYGQQSGGSSNPEQWTGTEYIHMHILRDVVNSESAWGETISPTTAGTLITKSYMYEIPEAIGNPNGVDVIIEHLHFLALLNEGNLYMQTACQLETVIAYDNVFPVMQGFDQIHSIACDYDGTFDLTFMNGGLDNLTSCVFEVEYAGQTYTYNWEGDIATGDVTTVQFPITLVDGTNSVVVNVVEGNGQAIEPSNFSAVAGSLTAPEWVSNVNTNEITINIWQDRYGNHITWFLYASDSTIIAQGGPYFQLGGNTTKLRTHTVALPTDPDCIQFVIYDSECDGINNGHGEGHLEILDAAGNQLWANDGNYTCEAKINFSINSEVPVIPGDANGDGQINVADITTIVSYILLGSNPQIIIEAADYNGDGLINILDIQSILADIY